MAVSAPLTTRITDELRAMIHAGAFPDGRLAPEPTVARRLGVSRATLRQALAQLATEGVIIRKRGSGTFVNQHILQITTRLEEVWDFAEMIRLSGFTPGVRPCGTALGPATDQDQARLGLSPGDEVLAVTNVFLAGTRPVIYCRDVIPGRLVRQAYQWEELYGPVYAFLERRCGQAVSYNITDVLTAAASRTLARHLECPAGTPLHYFDEVGYNAAHEAILYSQEYYVPDAFRFTVVRKLKTASPALKAPAPGRTRRRRQPAPAPGG